MLLFVGFNSCKKDDFKTPIVNPDEHRTHQISNADIAKWAKENPVVQYLALDWKNAKQTIYQGRQVIKITLLKENRLPAQKTDGRKVNGIGLHTQTTVPSAYFNQHPPEVFLVKDDKDSLHSSLLNFIPDNQTSGFGQNGKWTGKLYEWNMNSDSLFVQEIQENRVLLRYITKAVTPPTNTDARNNVKTNISFSGIGNFFQSIGNFFNNLGYFMGLPFASNVSWYSNSCHQSTGSGYDCVNTYSWAGDAIGWMGNLFAGEGGNSVYGNYGYNNIYLLDYGGGAGSQINPTGGGGGSGSPVYTPYPINVGSGGFAGGSIEANELINDLEITDSRIQNFLRSNDVASVDFYGYLIGNSWSTESKDFVLWGAGYLADNPNVDFEVFKDEYLINKPNINDVVLPALIDTTGLSQFPKFKEILTNLPSFLNTYPNVRKALAYYTGFTEAEVMSKMQPGKGPKLIVISMAPNLYGHYDAVSKTLQINSSFVNGLEVAQLPKTIQATALLLAITTFHEFVHYGRDDNKLKNLFTNPNSGKTEESGWSFERSIDPNNAGLNKYNAIKWLDFYPFNF